MKVLIANRGEVAVRIARAAAELGAGSVSVYGEDDADSRHVTAADDAQPLRGSGAAPYLDAAQLVEAAREAGCDAVHPGYGFLSEDASFARAVAEAGLTFVGPQPEVLELFGDKARALALARAHDVPVLRGTEGAATREGVRELLASLGDGGAVLIKALAGGGGRGIRIVRRADEIDDAFTRCESEARAATGRGEVYAEQFLPRARHVEVQVVADRSGHVTHLGERDCTLQRRCQKIVEIAPSPALSRTLRERLTSEAVRLARASGYDHIGTFEFLVDMEPSRGAPGYAFMEANPRLQVEHTVTEEVTGVDLVQTQLECAGGRSLAEVGLGEDAPLHPRGYAMQLRINAERVEPDGRVVPASGTLSAFEPPAGPGIRVDTCAHVGATVHPGFDPLLLKMIAHVHAPRFEDVVARASRALRELRIEGVATSAPLLQRLLARPELVAHGVHTRFVDDHVGELVDAPDETEARSYPPYRSSGADFLSGASELVASVALRSPVQGRVVTVDVHEGDAVRAGQQTAVVEAMKMEHVIEAPRAGVVRRVGVAKGAQVAEDEPLLYLDEMDDASDGTVEAEEDVDLDAIREDLAEVQERRALGGDESRPDAVARRRKRGQRTARENLAHLCDEGSFVEYGSFVIAAQRTRRSQDDLIRNTAADGLIAGLATVNGDRFGETRARCMVISYDYTVLAGTQGVMGHKKLDRMIDLAGRQRLPIILFAEGGGGRPGDADMPGVAGLDIPSFAQYARLSGQVPRIAIVSGRCFAGNAALAGCSDILIATENATLGMGGPAMIEGGGLGSYRPEEVGPIDVQAPNGVVDLRVPDEGVAVDKAKHLFSFFQGGVDDWQCADQRWLRRAVPTKRTRLYDVRSVIDTLADEGSVVELRREFAPTMITAMVRIEGRPMGLIANDPKHLAGAIDAPGADKAARFMQLCDAFGFPVLSLCDTPGIMVGPEAEKTALVRHASRMFVTGSNLSVPLLTVVLRRGYGLGAQAMAGGSFHTPSFTVAWPTGEFGGMGLEGAVRLGYRKELEAIEDPDERQAKFEEMVALAYEHGKALNMASYLEIDEVIDPADTRRWIASALSSTPQRTPEPRASRFVDTW